MVDNDADMLAKYDKVFPEQKRKTVVERVDRN